MKINFHNQTNYNVKEYQKIIKKALKKEKSTSMEVIFTTNEQIKDINNSFRQINEVTDVISFPNEDSENSIGDVFISIDKALAQAKLYGHSNLREIAFLAVHGYLHLLGYDHLNELEEKAMFALQEEILTKAKIERK